MNPNPLVSDVNKIRIMMVSSAEQARRVEQAIARRAYELFERRGGIGGHEREDWRQAEAEERCKFCFGLTRLGDALLVGCDIARFEDGSVEIWVAPDQMTICGKPFQREEQRPNPKNQPYQGLAFRVVILPAEIDPGRVVAKLRRNFLEIRLPTKHSREETIIRAHAA
jgi:HSP20 family molecular chaperone IbpA